MKPWSVYLELQTKLAYGDSHSAPSPSTAREHEILAEWLGRLNAERPFTSALIIGPGGAHELNALEPFLPVRTWVLTAHEPEAHSIASKSPIRTYRGDLHEMPYLFESFDFVHCSNVLEHVLAPYIALMEIRRVLKPGGVASFVMPSFDGDEGGVGPFHLHCLDEKVWRELLRKTGYSISDVVVQPGVSPASTKEYYHFRCVAGTPPSPHDKVLHELTSNRAPDAQMAP